jgi:uridine kinase
MMSEILFEESLFSETLFEKMKIINSAVKDLELYEFQYALVNLIPVDGWKNVQLNEKDEILTLINQVAFYEQIQLKPRIYGQIVLDVCIIKLTNMLFVGIVTGDYEVDWINQYFYFDLRGFFFLPKTIYFNEEIRNHFGKKPQKQFTQGQEKFKTYQDIGYREFKEANKEIDHSFIKIIDDLMAIKGTPFLLTIAGPTAAGKTEIADRLRDHLRETGKLATTIEMDNFYLDREIREKESPGIEAIHYDIFKSAMENILKGQPVSIPRYDFIDATSSHDVFGNLKPGRTALEINPADIIFLEGNFPFQMEEFSHIIGTIVVYLTHDEIRLKRKWKRDIDYRKKYDPTYFRNRYFRTQFLRAKQVYQPLMAVCDIVVDTTNAEIWMTPEIIGMISSNHSKRITEKI